MVQLGSGFQPGTDGHLVISMTPMASPPLAPSESRRIFRLPGLELRVESTAPGLLDRLGDYFERHLPGHCEATGDSSGDEEGGATTVLRLYCQVSRFLPEPPVASDAHVLEGGTRLFPAPPPARAQAIGSRPGHALLLGDTVACTIRDVAGGISSTLFVSPAVGAPDRSTRASGETLDRFLDRLLEVVLVDFDLVRLEAACASGGGRESPPRRETALFLGPRRARRRILNALAGRGWSGAEGPVYLVSAPGNRVLVQPPGRGVGPGHPTRLIVLEDSLAPSHERVRRGQPEDLRRLLERHTAIAGPTRISGRRAVSAATSDLIDRLLAQVEPFKVVWQAEDLTTASRGALKLLGLETGGPGPPRIVRRPVTRRVRSVEANDGWSPQRTATNEATPSGLPGREGRFSSRRGPGADCARTAPA